MNDSAVLRLVGLSLSALTTFAFSSSSAAQQDLQTMKHHAHGTFTVVMQPLESAPAPGLSRISLKKELHGDLEGSSLGEMLGGGDYKKGAAGYVAMEMVTGSLHGKAGSFALEHLATMDSAGPNMTVLIVPGSGTGALAGIGGVFKITITKAGHEYDIDYTLPDPS